MLSTSQISFRFKSIFKLDPDPKLYLDLDSN